MSASLCPSFSLVTSLSASGERITFSPSPLVERAVRQDWVRRTNKKNKSNILC